MEKIEMHDLIEDMGKYIVKMQKDSGKPSRIWNVKDFEDVMVDNTGTMAVEAIWFSYSKTICFSKEAMKNVQRLRILHIWHFGYESQSKNDGSIEYLSNNLCWFVWRDYPCKLLPQNFNPRSLVHLDLRENSLHHLWNETKQLSSLRMLDLCGSKSLKRTPDFTGMTNLEYLDLSECRSFEEVHHSLRCPRKLIELNLSECESLERFPYVNVESLELLDLSYCSSLEKFPEILERMKPELEINMEASGIIMDLSSFIHQQPNLTAVSLIGMNTLVSLPSCICKWKDLVKLYVSSCSNLESLPEEIGDLENLEELHASMTLISRPPSSIIRLNKLKVLNLSSCNLIDGGLLEDIGSLSSLEQLDLSGNNFEHLPLSIAQLGALRSLDLSNCKRLTQLREFPHQLDTINADWSNDSIPNSLFQKISSLQHDISASHSLSLRVFTSVWYEIPSWFHHQGMDTSVSVNLPENWYVSDNFLGFAVCYDGKLVDITAHLIPLCDDEMTQKFSLSNHSECPDLLAIHFFLVPFAGLWDASKANGKTPNDYEIISLGFGEKKKFGVRLLYKDEAELHIGIRRSRDEEGSSSSSKKQRSQFPKRLGL